MKKKFVVLLSAAMMVGGMTIGVGAAPVLEKITAHLNWGINYEVNGKQWTPQDQSGKRIAAITYNNTTYLPVRAVSDALGVAVNYDNKSQKISLGEKNSTTPITSENIKGSFDATVTKDKQYTVHNGKDYGSGVIMQDITTTRKFTMLPGGKHQTLELTIIPLSVKKDVTVKVFDGDVLLKEISVTPSDSAQTVTFDIGGAKELQVEAKLVNLTVNGESLFITGQYK